MDGKLWSAIYEIVMTIEHPNLNSQARHHDRTIALVYFRAVADDQPVVWGTRPENWAGLKRPESWPSQPTMSRRLRSPEVQALIQAVEDRLQSFNDPHERSRFVDGRALLISPFSKDRHARWGYAIKGFGFGYKFHAVWGKGAMPDSWAVCPLNAAESRVAAQTLLPRLPSAVGKRYLIGDAAYDSNPLHAASSTQGYQLLAPPKRVGKGLGHCSHHPARVRGLQHLQTRYGRRLYRQRSTIERHFGHWAMRSEGLDELPVHVRGLRRVSQFVQAKLIINGCRILLNKQLLQPKLN